MTLLKCEECGHDVSSQAEKCPGCGCPPPKPENKPSSPKKDKLIDSTLYAVLGIFILIIAIGVIHKFFNPTDEIPQQTAQQSRQEKINKGFLKYSGAHIGLQVAIKHYMNDPDSYEHIKTNYTDHGDHLIVNTQFRGKNMFGGLVINEVSAKTDLDGNVLEIISQSP